MLVKLMQMAVLVGLLQVSAEAQMASTQGIEVSAVSGFYQTEKSKTNGTNSGGESSFSLGGRVHQFISDDQQWFALASLALTSWDAPSGTEAPDNGTSIMLMGGLRQFFTEFSQVVIPYAAVYGGYKNIKSGTVGVTPTETETSGLYYYGAVGFRFDVAADTFFELECALFESALFGTEITKTGGTKTETTKTELFISSANGVSNNLTIAVGMEI